MEYSSFTVPGSHVKLARLDYIYVATTAGIYKKNIGKGGSDSQALVDYDYNVGGY